LGVFDGHGECGHEISDFIAKTLPQNLLSILDNDINISKALKTAFKNTQEKLIKESSLGTFDCSFSGSTATLCIIDKLNCKIYTACVGDSRAIVSNKGRFKKFE